jgi:hypothetical protein
MRIRYIATFAETILTDPVTLAREYLSARDATSHELQSDEARDAYVDVLAALGRFQHRTAFARALAQLDVPPNTVEVTQQDLCMRPIAWSFGRRDFPWLYRQHDLERIPSRPGAGLSLALRPGRADRWRRR